MPDPYDRVSARNRTDRTSSRSKSRLTDKQKDRINSIRDSLSRISEAAGEDARAAGERASSYYKQS